MAINCSTKGDFSEVYHFLKGRDVLQVYFHVLVKEIPRSNSHFWKYWHQETWPLMYVEYRNGQSDLSVISGISGPNYLIHIIYVHK